MGKEANTASGQPKQGLTAYLSPAGAWAFALGTSIGWGSLVVTSNTYLVQAGPAGSILGLLVGAAVMLVIARNYHYLLNRFPSAGGAYAYAKEAFGYDHGFLTAWFVLLTYLAMFWANATSLPLFARYFVGDVFQFGFHYTVFDYEVYFGEALLTIAAILVTALLCSKSKRMISYAMIVFAWMYMVGITASFGGGMSGAFSSGTAFNPAFVPDASAISQIVLIACISPWAFVGFENISHSAEEFAFKRSMTFRIMAAAIATATALYIFVMLLSVSAYPPEYDSWLAYISDLGNLEGIKALPPFYAAQHYLGSYGVYALMFALFALVISSLVGNIVALSRLFYALGQDGVLPKRFGQVSNKSIPVAGIMFVAALSLPVPFLGRTAIGWIVDVTTLGATIVYGLVSASAFKVANRHDDSLERTTGILGTLVMICFALYLLVPNLFLSGSLEPETYFLFAVWAILGFLFFRLLLNRDTEKRFGRSVVVWTALLSLVMFVSLVWMGQTITGVADQTVDDVAAHYVEAGHVQKGDSVAEAITSSQQEALNEASIRVMIITATLLAIASALLLANFSYVSRWAQRSDEELTATKGIINSDRLTKLPSTPRFMELAAIGAEVIASQGERPVAIAFSLVGLRDYAAKNGPEAADELICEFANVLRRHFGSTACSRFSEGRFDAFSAESGVAEKLEGLFNDFSDPSSGPSLPVKVGAYVCKEGEEFGVVVFDHARAACELDTDTWHSHVEWFSEAMDDRAKVRFHILEHIDQAVAEGWIRPYYQAIIDAETGYVCSEEALARWIDPELGPISPGQFIPVLEEAGLLHKADMHMIDCVLRDLKEKQEAGRKVVPVSVNISLSDLGQVDLAPEILAKANAAGVSHDMLRIEFTESVASNDPALLAAEIEALHANGFEVWMDDFGSGYSSLNSLKNFPFDVVKLDMEFLRDADNQRTWDVIGGVIRINKQLGMKSLAEGVEEQWHAERLHELGCDMLQGYLFTRPLPLEEVMLLSGTKWNF